jgi:arabinofuranosyltransferase
VRRHDRTVLTFIVAAFLLYAAAFIYRTSFVVDGERYFSLFDDAMVSMRYGRNLAHGYGLIWNPGGERVEGYTNLLWVLYMAAVHLLPIGPARTSLVIQITAAVLLAANLCLVHRIALAITGGSRTIAWGSVLLTAAYLPINNWGLQGMEVSVLVLLVSVCSAVAIDTLDTGTFRRSLYLLLGVAMFVRPDMIVTFAAFLLFMAAADPLHRRQHVAWGLLVLAGAAATQTIFRLSYYGDVVPNTYYLKIAGAPFTVRVERGLYVLMLFIWKSGVALVALPFILAIRRDRRVWLLLWILTAQMAYSVGVGGDAWEYWGGSNRYISIAMPGFFIVLASALHLIAASLAGFVRPDAIGTAQRRATGWLFALAVVYAIVSVNAIHGIGALGEALLIRPTLDAGGGGENQRDVEQALALKRATAGDARIAVLRAGTIPYFADRPAIDLLGKNDARVAHGPSAAAAGGDFRDFRPGHMKYNFAYSIGKQKPDVVVQLRRREPLARPFLQDYEKVWLGDACAFVLRGSPRVAADVLSGHGCTDASYVLSSTSASGLLQGTLSGS